jgi:catechol 2,3-dioxygenase-like lactoylglutathione lyase family enzyme
VADSYPRIQQVVLDTTDARALAEFYRQLFGLAYRDSDVPPPDGEPDPRGQDWLVLRNPHGGPQLAFQQTEGVRPSTWPEPAVPQMFHLDTVVSTREELETQRRRALDLGATLRLDRTDDEEEPLYVFADPAGHPFCIFVG